MDKFQKFANTIIPKGFKHQTSSHFLVSFPSVNLERESYNIHMLFKYILGDLNKAKNRKTCVCHFSEFLRLLDDGLNIKVYRDITLSDFWLRCKGTISVIVLIVGEDKFGMFYDFLENMGKNNKCFLVNLRNIHMVKRLRICGINSIKSVEKPDEWIGKCRWTTIFWVPKN